MKSYNLYSKVDAESMFLDSDECLRANICHKFDIKKGIVETPKSPRSVRVDEDLSFYREGAAFVWFATLSERSYSMLSNLPKDVICLESGQVALAKTEKPDAN